MIAYVCFAVVTTAMATIGGFRTVVDANNDNLVLRVQHLLRTSHWKLERDEVVCDSDGKTKTLANVFVETVRSGRMENYNRACGLYASALTGRSLKYASLLTAYGYYQAVVAIDDRRGSQVDACPKILWQLKNAFETISRTFGRRTRGRRIEQLETIDTACFGSPSSRCIAVLRDLKTYLENALLSRYPPRPENDRSSLTERVQNECRLRAESKNERQVLKADHTTRPPFDGEDLNEIYRSVLNADGALIVQNEPDRLGKSTVRVESFDFLKILEKVNREYQNISTDNPSAVWDSSDSGESISDEPIN